MSGRLETLSKPLAEGSDTGRPHGLVTSHALPCPLLHAVLDGLSRQPGESREHILSRTPRAHSLPGWAPPPEPLAALGGAGREQTGPCQGQGGDRSREGSCDHSHVEWRGLYTCVWGQRAEGPWSPDPGKGPPCPCGSGRAGPASSQIIPLPRCDAQSPAHFIRCS